MADEKHLERLHLGPDAVREWITLNAGRRLDLSGAQLQGHDFQGWDLSDVNFQGANLEGARLDSATLVGAIFADAKLTGTSFANAKLNRADLQGTSLGRANLRNAELAGANLDRVVWEGANLSEIDLKGTRFQNAKLAGSRFSRAVLNHVDLNSADLSRAIFDDAKLDRAHLQRANFTNASLVRVSLRGALLTNAIFIDTNLDRADFFEAYVDHANFDHARGLTRTNNLHTVRFSNPQADVHYFDSIVIPLPERTLSWERIRFLGRLPLFGASYSALVAIPFLYYLLDMYNKKVDVFRAWAEQEAVNAGAYHLPAKVVLEHLHREPIPSLSLWLLISTVLLGIGATIFAFFCPTRIREFSRDQWCDELRHSLVHYWPFAWRHRWLRIACLLFYILGGLGVLIVIVSKLWNVFWFIVANE